MFINDQIQKKMNNVPPTRQLEGDFVIGLQERDSGTCLNLVGSSSRIKSLVNINQYR
jgi:hypothetical protein